MLARSLTLAVLAASAVFGQDAIHFERDFPGAVPSQFAVRLAADGSARYSEEGEEPLEFSVGAAESGRLFAWAEDLGRFAKPLASKRRVASTGKKRLRYESEGTVVGEAVFDYSDVRTARELVSWFVRLAETQQHIRSLERALRFDRLGVNDALVSAEGAFDGNRLAAPTLLVPILEQISTHGRLVHLARARAAGLVERIRAADPAAR